MLFDQLQRLRDTAAEETLARVRRDRAGASLKVRPLLEYLETHLFDPELNVTELKRACGVRDNSIAIHFHAAVGQPPRAYIEERRFDTAVNLLRDTDLPVGQISELLGYSTLQVFSDGFSRWSGQRPTAFRKDSRSAVQAETPAADAVFDDQLWSRAFGGELEPHRAQRLIQQVRRLYWEQLRRTEPKVLTFVRIPIESRDLERIKAEAVWNLIADRPVGEQKAIILDGLGFTSPALFDLLRAESRRRTGSDPEAAVRLAELALESLTGSELFFGESPAEELKARGWGWLGHTRALAGDLAGAEQAFGEADHLLDLEERAPRTIAEVSHLESLLRLQQRRFADAMTLAGRALAFGRSSGEDRFLAEILVQRAMVSLQTDAPGIRGPSICKKRSRCSSRPARRAMPWWPATISSWPTPGPARHAGPKRCCPGSRPSPRPSEERSCNCGGSGSRASCTANSAGRTARSASSWQPGRGFWA